MANEDKILSRAETVIRQEIFGLIKQALDKELEPSLVPIDFPPQAKMGDYSVACFLLAEFLKKKPVEVSSFLAEKISPTELIDKIQFLGPYLNFFINQVRFNELVLTQIAKLKSKYGASKTGKGKKIMVEFFSPNTNKPLTIGHVRNICLGSSLSRLLKFTGHKIIEATLYNDRGIAIAKAIVGYQKWGEEKTPKDLNQKPDHFVGSFYTKFCQEAKQNPNLEAEAKKVLKAWEEDKKEIRAVWQKLMTWVLEGFKQTLADLNVGKFDEEYFESEYYQAGKEVVEKGLKKGVFTKNQEGVILAPLDKFGLPDKIVLRPDDTSLYITQDLHLAYLKDKYKLDSSIYVVGSEQDLYFKQLFKILELLGFKNAINYHHLSYGMIRLRSGKIKSREGLVQGTGADDLLTELEKLAEAEIKQRFSAQGGSQPPLGKLEVALSFTERPGADAPLAHALGGQELAEAEIKQRAKQIALAALKFYILTVGPKTTMVFNPQKSLAFAGRTGPYLQYVYARINSIFAKAETKPTTKIDFSVLNNQLEFELIKILAKFPSVILDSVKSYDPSALANYLYDLAKAFSLFYEKLPVLQAEKKVKKARLLLINSVRIVLGTGLDLLGISVLEKM